MRRGIPTGLSGQGVGHCTGPEPFTHGVVAVFCRLSLMPFIAMRLLQLVARSEAARTLANERRALAAQLAHQPFSPKWIDYAEARI